MSTAPSGKRSATIAHIAALTLASAALVVMLVGCGWAITAGHTKWLFIPSAAIVLYALARHQRGAFIGVLVLVAMNGVPFVDTSYKLVHGKLTVEDLAAMFLILISGAWILFSDGSYRPNRSGRAISALAILLFLWWLIRLGQTSIAKNISLLSAADFGKDFAFFALLLIVLPWVRLTNRDIAALLGVLATGVCLFAVGQIMVATGLGQPGNLIHFEKTLQETGFTGLTRVYANMTDMVTAGVAASVAAIILARDRRARLIAVPIAVLLTTSTIVQLTRARWIGLIVGLVLVSAWFVLRGGTHESKVLSRRLGMVLGTLILAGSVMALADPGILFGGTAASRLSSLFSELQNGGGTLTLRKLVLRLMKTYLGGKWLTGLGFIPPTAHWFVDLPHGSIRDADLGVFNAVMTMGAIGAALIYLPVITVLGHCLGRRPAQEFGAYSWLRYGGAIWLVATLVSSVTLVTLFSTSGLMLVSIASMILVRSNASEALAPSTVSNFRLEVRPSARWRPAELATGSNHR